MRGPAHAKTPALFLFALISVLLAGCTMRDSPQDPPPSAISHVPDDSYGSSYSMRPTVANNPAYKKRPLARKYIRAKFPRYVIMLPEYIREYGYAYKGATFPLYCGYITIDENDMPIFVKKANYPINLIDNLLMSIKGNNGNIPEHLVCNSHDWTAFCEDFLGNAVNGFIMFDYEKYYDIIQWALRHQNGITLLPPAADSRDSPYFEHPELMMDDNYVPQFTKTCTLTGDREADSECLNMKFPGHITDYIKKENPPKIWRPSKEKGKALP